MADYRNNQFLPTSDWLKPKKEGEWTNAPFTYPRRVVRYVNVEESGDVTYVSKQLDRGFMRSLVTESLTPAGFIVQSKVVPRFNFQFNPQDIKQEVEMRQDVSLALLQNPVQFAQPMSAVANFNFDIFLDRTMEVANGDGTGSGDSSSPEERRYVPRSNPEGDINPVVDVYQYGVLSDLQVLYAIIGQGFSNNFIRDQMELIKAQAKNQLTNDSSLDATSQASQIAGVENTTFDGSINIGNSAFLIPMPVRVVFSELFMVDGFVTRTFVQYTKFNTNMVPIQASIGIAMNAIYIGFAKQDTFLTAQISNGLNTSAGQVKAEIAKQGELLNAAGQSAVTFVFATALYSTKYEQDWKKTIIDRNSDTTKPAIAEYVVGTLAVAGYGPHSSIYSFGTGFKEAAIKEDKIKKLYEEGSTASISYNWVLKIWGPYDTLAEAMKETKSKSPTKKQCGQFSGSKSASDKQTWIELKENIYSDTELKSMQSSGMSLPGYSVDYSEKYFVSKIEVSVSMGGQIVESKESDEWGFSKGSSPLYREFNLNWPNTSGMGGNTGGTP